MTIIILKIMNLSFTTYLESTEFLLSGSPAYVGLEQNNATPDTLVFPAHQKRADVLLYDNGLDLGTGFHIAMTAKQATSICLGSKSLHSK